MRGSEHRAPKYALPELERRWLVSLDQLPVLDAEPYRTITDKYLDGGRLRLRKDDVPGSEPLFKLGKTYVPPTFVGEEVTLAPGRSGYALAR